MEVDKPLQEAGGPCLTSGVDGPKVKPKPFICHQLASLFYHDQNHPLSGGLKGNNPNPFSDFDNPQKLSK